MLSRLSHHYKNVVMTLERSTFASSSQQVRFNQTAASVPFEKKSLSSIIKPKPTPQAYPTSSMTPFSPTAPSPPLSAEAILQMKFVHITNAIDSCRVNKFNSPAAVEALRNARMSNIRLSPDYLIQGIAACGSSMRDLKTFDLAYWAFGVLKSEKNATMEVFENMMYICSKYGRVDSAAELMRDFFAAGYTYTSYLLSTYLLVIANSGTQSEVNDLLEPLYVTYRDLSNQRTFAMSNKVFMSVAECHCRNGNSDRALAVLRDLTEINQQPSASLCAGLLEVALQSGDCAVLRVLLSWYKTNFNITLPEGQCRRTLHIAAGLGDGQLGLMGFQMLRDAKFEPTSSDYCSLLQSLLLNNDIGSAAEVLQEMARNNIQITHSVTNAAGEVETVFHYRQYRQLRTLFATAITGSVNRFEKSEENLEEGRTMLDGLYFALVENVRTATEAHSASQHEGEADPAVPRLLLDAIVEATGKLQLSERAFSVFQEYTPVFRVTPDVNSYNALLSSCAQQRKVVISAIFAIFQEMEANNIEANEESFSILLQAITTCKEFDIYEQVFEHMLSKNVLASRVALTYAVLSLSRSPQHYEMVDVVRDLIIAQRAGLPPSILSPLSSLKETLAEAQAADPRANKDGIYRCPLDTRLLEHMANHGGAYDEDETSGSSAGYR